MTHLIVRQTVLTLYISLITNYSKVNKIMKEISEIELLNQIWESLENTRSYLLGETEVGEHTIKYGRLNIIETNTNKAVDILFSIKKLIIALVFVLLGILLVLIFK